MFHSLSNSLYHQRNIRCEMFEACQYAENARGQATAEDWTSRALWTFILLQHLLLSYIVQLAPVLPVEAHRL